jgi:hypothetical protein
MASYFQAYYSHGFYIDLLLKVDRRYMHYCNQMKAVVASFEAVAGDGIVRQRNRDVFSMRMKTKATNMES